MQKRSGSRIARFMLLVAGLNAVVLAAWLTVTSIVGARVTPGLGPPDGNLAGGGWSWGLAVAAVWLTVLAAWLVLLVGRVLLMRWMFGSPASTCQHAVTRQPLTIVPRCSAAEIHGPADEWMRRKSKV
jgi:hypothetical protein